MVSDGVYECKECARAYTSEYNYRRHCLSQLHLNNVERVKGGGEPAQKFVCEICNAAFIRRDNYARHLATHERGEDLLRFRCGLCSKCYHRQEELEEHRRSEHVRHHDFRLEESAHHRQCQVLRAYFPDNVRTMDQALFYAYSQLQALLISSLVEMPFFKCNITLYVEMARYSEEGGLTGTEVFPFRGLGVKLSRETDLMPELRKSFGDIERHVDEFLYQGSGWVVEKPLYLEVELAQCKVLRGSASCGFHLVNYRRYRGVVPTNITDESARRKKKEEEEEEEERDDGMCFYLAVASHFLPNAASRAELREFVEKKFVLPEKKGHRCGGGEGVSLEEVRRFEEDNAHLGLSVNVVYRDEKGAVVPVVASTRPLAPNIVVLLLFYLAVEGEEEKGIMHYARVEKPGQIFANRTEDSFGKMRTTNVFVCFNCFNTIATVGGYEKHVAFCHQRHCQRVQLPERGDVLKFDAGKGTGDPRTFRSAYLLFFDFEALQVDPSCRCICPEEKVAAREWWDGLTSEEREELLLEQVMLEGEMTDEWEAAVKVDGSKVARPKPVPMVRRLPKMCEHKLKVMKNQPPFAYSLLMANREGEVLESKTYVGLDAAENFISTVLNLADKHLPELTPGVPMEKLNAVEKKILYSATSCYLCSQPFTPFCRKCLDHDHVTGKVLGTAHDGCNLHRREQVQLSCFAHNFSGYDSHFLVRALNKEARVGELFAIPLNTQKFKSVTVNQRIRFLDSFQFLPSSLSALVDTLVASKHPFRLLDTMVTGEEEKALLLRKGVYPYSFATSPEALTACESLPPRDAFFSDLSGAECSEEDYAHAQKVWEVFRCRNMMDYTALYVRGDVHLLAEAVINFRDMVWKNFGLDMCQYLSLPHVAKDAMLKYTKARIELVHDQEMSYLLQNNIRGGLSFVNVRHAKRIAEEELPARQGHGVRTVPQTMLYVDANNLYGFAMSAPLPERDFRWMTADELESFDPARDVSLNDGPGYILEVDLEYPEELHLSHNSFPLAPESAEIGWSHLSPYSRSCLRALGQDPTKYKATKLTSTFHPRRKYLVHGLNLALYLKHGLRLTKIHRGITFHQSRYLESYITMCTKKRAEAHTKAEADMFKLFCNSAYGKVRARQKNCVGSVLKLECHNTSLSPSPSNFSLRPPYNAFEFSVPPPREEPPGGGLRRK